MRYRWRNVLIPRPRDTAAGQVAAGNGVGAPKGDPAKRREIWVGARLMLPVAAGGTVDGIVFGALAAAAGLGHLAPVVISATSFSSSAQYALIAVLRDHGSVLAALLAAAALNVRYLAMSATVAASTTGSRWVRAARCLLLTDESWAVTSSADVDISSGGVLVGAGLTELLGWILGTAVGVFVGNALGSPSRLGLDAAIPALFIWVLRGQLTARRDVAAALAGGALAAVLVPVVPAGIPVLAAGLAAAAWGACRSPSKATAQEPEPEIRRAT